MQFINKAYLLIGGNVGNRLLYLQKAVELINLRAGKINQRSAMYETAAWGNTRQAAFLNQALELFTGFNAGDLMSALLGIEEQMGRKRLEKYGSRIIDIDILLFNQEVHTTPRLNIPHPELPNRRFALEPLVEIAGNVQHPVLDKSISQLLKECKDTLPVIKLNESDLAQTS